MKWTPKKYGNIFKKALLNENDTMTKFYFVWEYLPTFFQLKCEVILTLCKNLVHLLLLQAILLQLEQCTFGDKNFSGTYFFPSNIPIKMLTYYGETFFHLCGIWTTPRWYNIWMLLTFIFCLHFYKTRKLGILGLEKHS